MNGTWSKFRNGLYMFRSGIALYEQRTHSQDTVGHKPPLSGPR